MKPTSENATLVEFFGMPGAGKSTVAHRVAETLRNHDVLVNEPTYVLAHQRSSLQRYQSKFRYAVRASIKNRDLALHGTRAVLASDQYSRQSALKNEFNWLYVSGTITDTNPHSLQLLDQGFVQAAWSIELSAQTPPDLKDLLMLALSRPVRTLVVTVDVSAETAKKRLLNRSDGDSRVLQNGSRYTIADAVATTNRHQAYIDSITRTIPTVDCLSVENERPADLPSCVDQITTSILNLSTVSGSKCH